jgi:hypothetical protein
LRSPHRQHQFEHPVAVCRLNLLRIDVLGERELALEPAIPNVPDDGLCSVAGAINRRSPRPFSIVRPLPREVVDRNRYFEPFQSI